MQGRCVVLMPDEVPDGPNAGTDHCWLDEAWAHRPQEIDVPVEGAAIRCRTWQAERTDLPGIVLVHGFRAHARWWDHIAPLLCETHRVVALDLSGMGDSDRRPSYARAQHAREILAVADTLGFDRPVIIGHSYGGLLGLMACNANPGRVTRLIVVDSALPVASDGLPELTTPPTRLYESREEAASRFRLIPSGRWPDPDILAYIAYHSVCETPEGWSWKFDSLAAGSLNLDPPYRPAMVDTRVPADFIYGDRSEILTPARRAEVSLLMPLAGAPIAIPASHHHILIEQPLALVGMFRGLLARPTQTT